jgi:hypothetical protein
MKLSPFTAGRVFDTSAAVDVAMVFVWTDMRFVRFTGPMDLTEEWVIGVPRVTAPSLFVTRQDRVLGCDQFDERGFPFWRLHNWSIRAGRAGERAQGR